MFFAAHVIVFSRDPEADRAFFRDVLEMPAVDAGHGWLIFRLPPAEMAFHPTDSSGEGLTAGDGLSSASVYLMSRDLHATMEKLAARGVACGPVHEAGWGVVTSIPLPGGGKLGLYEPHHPLAAGG